jgi:formylglycine-generating enzyme required for sulfatase activity
MDDNPSYFKGDDLPVEQVNWLDVQHFIKKLNDKTGQNYCLPTEAEWEYACRAGTTTPYYTGHSMTAEEANFNKNVGKTTPVGSYPPNPWGLYDMNGNLLQWLASVWSNGYQFSEQRANYNDINSRLAARAARGGSWWNDLARLRSASRGCCVLTSREYYFGFRLAKTGSQVV